MSPDWFTGIGLQLCSRVTSRELYLTVRNIWLGLAKIQGLGVLELDHMHGGHTDLTDGSSS